jgi:hypothetical protein
MTYRYSELIGIRDYAKETKTRVSSLYGMIVSSKMDKYFDLDIDPVDAEQTPLRIDDFGLLCDEIVRYCNEQLKLLDSKREK